MVARILLMLLIFFGQKYTVCGSHQVVRNDPGYCGDSEHTVIHTNQEWIRLDLS